MAAAPYAEEEPDEIIDRYLTIIDDLKFKTKKRVLPIIEDYEGLKIYTSREKPEERNPLNEDEIISVIVDTCIDDYSRASLLEDRITIFNILIYLNRNALVEGETIEKIKTFLIPFSEKYPTLLTDIPYEFSWITKQSQIEDILNYVLLKIGKEVRFIDISSKIRALRSEIAKLDDFKKIDSIKRKIEALKTRENIDPVQTSFRHFLKFIYSKIDFPTKYTDIRKFIEQLQNEITILTKALDEDLLESEELKVIFPGFTGTEESLRKRVVEALNNKKKVVEQLTEISDQSSDLELFARLKENEGKRYKDIVNRYSGKLLDDWDETIGDLLRVTKTLDRLRKQPESDSTEEEIEVAEQEMAILKAKFTEITKRKKNPLSLPTHGALTVHNLLKKIAHQKASIRGESALIYNEEKGVYERKVVYEASITDKTIGDREEMKQIEKLMKTISKEIADVKALMNSDKYKLKYPGPRSTEAMKEALQVSIRQKELRIVELEKKLSDTAALLAKLSTPVIDIISGVFKPSGAGSKYEMNVYMKSILELKDDSPEEYQRVAEENDIDAEKLEEFKIILENFSADELRKSTKYIVEHKSDLLPRAGDWGAAEEIAYDEEREKLEEEGILRYYDIADADEEEWGFRPLQTGDDDADEDDDELGREEGVALEDSDEEEVLEDDHGERSAEIQHALDVFKAKYIQTVLGVKTGKVLLSRDQEEEVNTIFYDSIYNKSDNIEVILKRIIEFNDDDMYRRKVAAQRNKFRIESEMKRSTRKKHRGPKMAATVEPRFAATDKEIHDKMILQSGALRRAAERTKRIKFETVGKGEGKKYVVVGKIKPIPTGRIVTPIDSTKRKLEEDIIRRAKTRKEVKDAEPIVSQLRAVDLRVTGDRFDIMMKEVDGTKIHPIIKLLPFKKYRKRVIKEIVNMADEVLYEYDLPTFSDLTLLRRDIYTIRNGVVSSPPLDRYREDLNKIVIKTTLFSDKEIEIGLWDFINTIHEMISDKDKSSILYSTAELIEYYKADSEFISDRIIVSDEDKRQLSKLFLIRNKLLEVVGINYQTVIEINYGGKFDFGQFTHKESQILRKPQDLDLFTRVIDRTYDRESLITNLSEEIDNPLDFEEWNLAATKIATTGRKEIAREILIDGIDKTSFRKRDIEREIVYRLDSPILEPNSLGNIPYFTSVTYVVMEQLFYSYLSNTLTEYINHLDQRMDAMSQMTFEKITLDFFVNFPILFQSTNTTVAKVRARHILSIGVGWDKLITFHPDSEYPVHLAKPMSYDKIYSDLEQESELPQDSLILITTPRMYILNEIVNINEEEDGHLGKLIIATAIKKGVDRFLHEVVNRVDYRYADKLDELNYVYWVDIFKSSIFYYKLLFRVIRSITMIRKDERISNLIKLEIASILNQKAEKKVVKKTVQSVEALQALSKGCMKIEKSILQLLKSPLSMHEVTTELTKSLQFLNYQSAKGLDFSYFKWKLFNFKSEVSLVDISNLVLFPLQFMTWKRLKFNIDRIYALFFMFDIEIFPTIDGVKINKKELKELLELTPTSVEKLYPPIEFEAGQVIDDVIAQYFTDIKLHAPRFLTKNKPEDPKYAPEIDFIIEALDKNPWFSTFLIPELGDEIYESIISSIESLRTKLDEFGIKHNDIIDLKKSISRNIVLPKPHSELTSDDEDVLPDKVLFSKLEDEFSFDEEVVKFLKLKAKVVEILGSDRNKIELIAGRLVLDDKVKLVGIYDFKRELSKSEFDLLLDKRTREIQDFKEEVRTSVVYSPFEFPCFIKPKIEEFKNFEIKVDLIDMRPSDGAAESKGEERVILKMGRKEYVL